MKIHLLMIGLISLCLWGCTDRPQIVTETKTVVIKPPAITPCERLTIKGCGPTTNGELYECGLEAIKKLWQCADQTDALIEWSKKTDERIKKLD